MPNPSPRGSNNNGSFAHLLPGFPTTYVPFGVTYVKIGTIQRRLAWPLHKDDTLLQSGRPTGLNIYAVFYYFVSETHLLYCALRPTHPVWLLGHSRGTIAFCATRSLKFLDHLVCIQYSYEPYASQNSRQIGLQFMELNQIQA
ncbi:hypothetical protein JAAARDRAFT_133635 [Jaapia argillacea MUCL 33604]|uniref:Uncharacterized protein n=1 Tax=Jaapia argillacea MUCL 33604 TaxID=933084 RepID=A0A067PWD2_9AGAM|nr:hypothetical protein JAAARDRAFT_133635 [Jaapia argillacea MUCL 33604]